MPDMAKVRGDLLAIKTYLNSQAIEAKDKIIRESFVESARNIDDALALLKEQEEEIENLKQTAQSMMEGICLLKEQESVVRCKDCKHWKQSNGHCPLNSIFTNNDWFCADGVKKDD